MRISGFLFSVFVAACGYAVAQPARFEVASIKPSDPNATGSSIWSDNGALNATNQTVRSLITVAWRIRDFQLTGGPGWVSSDRYNILAKPAPAEAAVPDAKKRDGIWEARIQSLLAERFGLVVHKETKEGEIYLLTVAKGGPRVKEFTTLGDKQGISSNRGRVQGFAAPMPMLAEHLSEIVGRPVIDRTNLTGKYDWKLEWTPDSMTAGADALPQSGAGPTIFTAVQEQLGLKLETSKGPIDMWMIDKVDRPSEN